LNAPDKVYYSSERQKGDYGTKESVTNERSLPSQAGLFEIQITSLQRGSGSLRHIPAIGYRVRVAARVDDWVISNYLLKVKRVGINRPLLMGAEVRS
jgi:hypothetical protein